MFKISTFSDGVCIAYINDKRYKYYHPDPARLDFLKNKFKNFPGKLLNVIKKEATLERSNDDGIARVG